MKAHDLAIALSLARDAAPGTYAELGASVGISASESHNAVRRLREAGIVDAKRRVRAGVLADFLVHGVRVSFPATPAALAVGVPTGAAAFDDAADLPAPEAAAWVWPSSEGSTRGLAIDPLHPRLPDAVVRDRWLHEALALVDLLRAGGTREVKWARQRVRSLLGLSAVPGGSVDVTSPTALHGLFSRQKILSTIRKWIAEPNIEDHRGGHPLTRVVLAVYRSELAEHLATVVPAGSWAPAPARAVRGAKTDGGARWWSYPEIEDALVGRRLIDELEPFIRRDDAGRVFLPRSRTSSARPQGEYDDPAAEWTAFLSTASEAALDFAAVLKADVRDFFPSVDPALAAQVVAQRTGAHPRVVGLLFRCLRAWTATGFAEGRGLPIEPHDVSRIVAHAMLKTVDDDFDDGFDLKYRRFMDDTLIFVESEAAAVRMRARYDHALAEWGLFRNARKTEIFTSRDAVADLGVDEQARIDAAGGDAATLLHLWRLFTIRESRKRPGVRRALRRLYGLLHRTADLVPDALRDLREPDLRAAACRYLAEQPLTDEQIAEILACWATELDPVARGDLADLAGALRTPPSPAIAAWAAEASESVDPEESTLRTALLFALFKHDVDGARLRGVLRAFDPRAAADPLYRSAACYVARATPGAEDMALWEAHGANRDEVRATRLLDDLQGGRLDEQVPDLVRLCTRRGRVHARLLPFLVLLARRPSMSADTRRRVENLRDPAARASIRRAAP